MDKKLKYFLISFISSLILMSLLFIVFPLIFATLFTNSFFPFGGFLGVMIFASFIPLLLIISLIIFIAITWRVAEKGTKKKSILIVISGFILPFILFWAFSTINTSTKITDYAETINQTELLMDLAIKENNPKYCEDISNLWGQKESDSVTRGSDQQRYLCYFWLAYSVGEYSYCDKIVGEIDDKITREIKNRCLLIAALKTKDKSYCLKSTGYSNPNLEISQCLGAVSRVVNDVTICNEIKEKYDSSGAEANRCFSRFALFSENITPCEQITNNDQKERCKQKVNLIGNFEQECDNMETAYVQSELAKKAQKLSCLADIKTFELDVQGCFDIFKDEKYKTCDKIMRVMAFKNQNPQLCEPAFLCKGCFTKQSEPTWCDYDYFYYLDRFHEFRVGY